MPFSTPCVGKGYVIYAIKVDYYLNANRNFTPKYQTENSTVLNVGRVYFHTINLKFEYIFSITESIL